MIPNGMFASEKCDPLGISRQLLTVAMILVDCYLWTSMLPRIGSSDTMPSLYPCCLMRLLLGIN